MTFRDQPDDLDQGIGKNLITRFLDRYPNLIAKFLSVFDKKPIKASHPNFMADCFRKLGGLIWKFNIPEDMWFNMDEKDFMMGMSDRCKVICGWRGRGITGKLAQDRNRELTTVIKIICENGTVMPLLEYIREQRDIWDSFSIWRRI